MAVTNSKVLFCYVPTGQIKPSPADGNTIYFMEQAKEIHVGDVVIARNISGEIPTIVVNGDANGNYVSNAVWDASTNTLTLTKSTLPEYTVTKQQSPDAGYSATYQLFKDNVATGDKINIPTDMVIESGLVVTITFDPGTNKLYDGLTDVTELIVGPSGTATAADAGPYIRLIVANTSEDRIYIKVTDLVDIYTGGTTSEAIVNIDGNNVITVTINKIEATKIIYRNAVPAVYTQVEAGATFDPDETYYTESGGIYTEDSTVTADNFDAKVAEGLYTLTTPAVTEQTVKAKIQEVENSISSAIADLDASPVGGPGKYLTSIVETDGIISATAGTADTVVTSASSNLVTSGAVFTAIDSATPKWIVVDNE